MTLPNVTPPAAHESTSLEQALEQSREAKEKVEDVAENLASTNRTVRRHIATGATMVPARVALQKGLDVEAKAHDAADDLGGVTDALTRGVDELHQVEATLVRAHKDLAATGAALAAARGEERAATHRAFHDAATGLPNRSLFDDRVANGISMAERHGWTLAVMFLDLDGFKRVNDTYGHAAGDAVLKAVATRLSQSARDEDTVCRNGGDEFLYLLVDPKGRENVERIARATLLRIARPIDAEGRSVVVGSSIGIAVYPSDGQTAEQLVRNADAALYQAKRQGSGHCFFGDA
jgi:diguanylate cyclase (GGDEF)-like protein